MVWWGGRALAKGEEITYNYQLDDCEGLFGRQVSTLSRLGAEGELVELVQQED